LAVCGAGSAAGQGRARSRTRASGERFIGAVLPGV
jgi:hypothetical protein